MTTLAEGTLPSTSGTASLSDVVSITPTIEIATANSIDKVDTPTINTNLLIEYATTMRSPLSDVVSVAFYSANTNAQITRQIIIS